MEKIFSLRQFKRKYGNHDQCLEAVKQMQFPENTPCPKCKAETVFYRVTNRSSYACKLCGWHVYPLAGTIFEKSTTPLDLWFFAMYLMVHTRSGISAKQLERMLGVTYKTAWRMFKQIRILMAEDPSLLEGIVEVDETFIGGKGKNRAYKWHGGIEEKEVLMGILKREGKVYIKHIPDTMRWTLINQIKNNVSTTARVITDQHPGYRYLPKLGYSHEFVNHSAKEYVRNDIHTQNIEGMWSTLKRGIYGVYRVVSPKYLQAYADEYAWRYNHRIYGGGMFDILLKQVTEVKFLQPALAQ